MRRWALATAGTLILVGPFGEGGRLPDTLALLHLASLALILMAAIRILAAAGHGRPAGRGSGALLLPVAALGLALLSSARAAYPYAAALGLMDILAAAGAAGATAVLLSRPGDLLVLRAAALISTTLQAVLAIAGVIRSGAGAAEGTFLNRNHLAAFIGIGLLLCVAAVDAALARGDRRAAAAWAGLAALHLAGVLPLQSRGAALGLAAAAAAFIVMRWPTWSRRARGVAMIVAASALVLVLGLVALRFARNVDPDRYTRLRIWRATCDMVRERPLLGLGPGMFPHEAPRHNFALARDPVRFGRQFQGAHSAVLTTAAESGLPLVLILATAVVVWTVPLLRRRGASASDAAARGVGLALVALAAQALVEDLQQRPAIVLTACLLAGSALAVTRGFRLSSPRPDVVEWRRPLTAGALVVVTAWIAAAGVLFPWAAWRAARTARAAGRSGLALMRRAARLDPLNAGYHLDLAMASLNSGPPDPLRYADAALELDRARRCDPRDPRLTLLRARLEARAGSVILTDPSAGPRTDALYDEAARLAPTDPRPRLEQAGYLADGGRLEESLGAARAASAIEPNYRRARLLEISLLLRLGRPAEAETARAALEATDRVVTGYSPDSSYASEIVADDAALRKDAATALNALPSPDADSSSH